jgi:molybdate transport system substrate-binding protein
MMSILRRLFLWVALLCSVLGTACRKDDAPSTKPPLVVYCAAGIRKPLEAAAAAFEAECRIPVTFQFGGSSTLLSQLRVAKSGDLFIAADAETMQTAKGLGFIREVLPFAVQTPVVAVRAGNPKAVASFDDLLRPEVRLALTNPETASIGKTVRAAAGSRWEALSAKVAVMKPTVTEIAADLSLGAVDAAVLWDALPNQFSGLEAVHIPELDAKPETASSGVLASSTQTAEALQFARFLAAPEKGGAILRSAGFTPQPGDAWAPKPELLLYSGGVNRTAIEALLQTFANREGVGMTTVFNGCGVLCATMKTLGDGPSSKLPDAYYACDLCFIPPVAEQFPEAFLLTETEIGIVVREGNPKGVKTLADLAQPGLRVGLCNAEQSTLGFMTRGIVKSSGLLESIHRNTVVEVPTADFLVNQMRAGALDAAIVYRVNVQAAYAPLEFLPLAHAGAKAVQPFAVRSLSPNRQLALRLLEFLKENRAEFERAGFVWRGTEGSVKSKQVELPEWLKANEPKR